MKLFKVFTKVYINLEQVTKVDFMDKHMIVLLSDTSSVHVLKDSSEAKALKRALGLK